MSGQEVKGSGLGEPRWQVDWGSVSSSVNLKQLQSLLEQQEERLVSLSEAKEKEVILILGSSGAGKSTVFNYLLGCEFEEGLSETGEEVLVPKEGQRAPAVMGDGVASETLVPNLFSLGDGAVIVDCPGFFDNRGSAHRVCAEIATQLAMKQASRLKVLVVISYQALSGKAEGFQELSRLLSHVFKEPDAILPSCLFLINKTPPGFKKEHFLTKIKELIKLRRQQLDTEAKRVESFSDSALDEKKGEHCLPLLSDLRLLLLIERSESLEVADLLRPKTRQSILGHLKQMPAVKARCFYLESAQTQKPFSDLMELLSGQACEVIEEKSRLENELKTYSVKQNFLTDVKQALDKKEGDVLGVFKARLQASYEELTQLEKEMANLESHLSSLAYEMKSLNQDAPVLYRSLREERASDREVIFALGSVAGLSGGVVGLGSGGLLASMSVVGGLLAGGVVGVGLGLVIAGGYAYYAKKQVPILISYEEPGVPFIKVLCQYPDPENSQYLRVLEEKPEQGLYRAEFRPAVFSYSGITAEVWVRKKDLPIHARRIREIPEEREQYEALLRERRACLESKVKEKEEYLQEVVAIEKAIKRGEFAPQVYAEKLKRLKEDNAAALKALEERMLPLELRLIELGDFLRSRAVFMQWMALASVVVQGPSLNYKRFLEVYPSLALKPALVPGERVLVLSDEKARSSGARKQAKEGMDLGASDGMRIDAEFAPLTAQALREQRIALLSAPAATGGAPEPASLQLDRRLSE